MIGKLSFALKDIDFRIGVISVIAILGFIFLKNFSNEFSVDAKCNVQFPVGMDCVKLGFPLTISQIISNELLKYLLMNMVEFSSKIAIFATSLCRKPDKSSQILLGIIKIKFPGTTKSLL